MQEYRSSLYHQAYVHAEEVTGEDVKLGRIVVKVFISLLFSLIDLGCGLLKARLDIVLVKIAVLDSHLFIKSGPFTVEVVKAFNDSLAQFNFLGQNLDVSRLFVVNHFGLFVRELSIFRHHL